MNFFAAASLSGPGRDFISFSCPSALSFSLSLPLPRRLGCRRVTVLPPSTVLPISFSSSCFPPRRPPTAFPSSPRPVPPGTGNLIPSSCLSPCPSRVFEHPPLVTDFDVRRGKKSSGPTMAIVLKATDHRCPPILAYASWSTVRLSRASRVVRRTVVPSCIPVFRRKCSWNTRGGRSSI